jgi:hypothetical protein
LIDEMRPFELLKLIRDGVVTNMRDLMGIPHSNSLFYLHVDRVLKALEELGWIEISKDEDLKPTKRIFEAQRALGLSLTQLAPYGDNSVVAMPLFGRPKDPPKPSNIFVLMPFADDLRAVYDDHIRAVADKLGITVTRADDFFAANSVITDVWNAITRAQVLIADCTGRNPNVFYELGIAHTIGKPVILIAQSKDDIPFDVQHIRTIIYDFTPRGMQDFEASLGATLKCEIGIPRTLADALVWNKELDG